MDSSRSMNEQGENIQKNAAIIGQDDFRPDAIKGAPQRKKAGSGALPSRRKVVGIDEAQKRKALKAGDGSEAIERFVLKQIQELSASRGVNSQMKLPWLRDVLTTDLPKTERRGAGNRGAGGMDGDDVRLETGEDAIQFFAKHGNNNPLKFVYCNLKENEEEYRPFDLEIVSKKKCASVFYTVSATGVVQLAPDQASEYTSLSDWMRQSNIFNVLRSIPFFKHYINAKMFRLWRSNVRFRLFCKQRKLLCRNLFLSRPSFCGSLIEVNKLICELEQMKMMNIRSSGGPVLMKDFMHDQDRRRSDAMVEFDRTFIKLAAEVEKVCKGVKERARQYDHGIVSDDLANSRFAQHLLKGNGRVKSMVSIKKERADRVRKLKHAALEADMLGDFIRLVDYMEVETLVGITTDGIADYFKILESPGRKSMFLTFVSFSPRGLAFEPTVEHFQSAFETMASEIEKCVDSFDRILHQAAFKPFVSQQLSDKEYPHVQSIIKNDRRYTESTKNVTNKIDKDFKSAQDAVAILERHRPIYEFGLKWDPVAYRKEAKGVLEVQADMAELDVYSKNIEGIKKSYDGGMFEAETKSLKDNLMPIVLKASTDMKEVLLSEFSTKCTELQEAFREKMKQIDEDPESLHHFAQHVEVFQKTKEEGKELNDRAKKVDLMHSLLTKYEVEIPAHDLVLYENVVDVVKKFADSVASTEQNVEDKMAGMKQKVYQNISRLNTELVNQKNLLNEGDFVSDQPKPKQVLGALQQTKLVLDDIKNSIATVQSYQTLFDMEPYVFSSLPEAMKMFDQKSLFWNTYQTWLDKSDEWNRADFLTLDVEKMDMEIKEYFTTATRMTKEIRDKNGKDVAVTVKLRKIVMEQKQLMPIVLELGNKAMKTKHWKKLMQKMGQTWTSEKEIKLKKLRALNLPNFKGEISEVCGEAVGEHNLEEGIAKVEKIWNEMNFIIVPYQKAKDCYILGDIEEIAQLLEEHVMTLSSMVNSPFIEAVRTAVETWDRRLVEMQETLEEWLNCQRAWMYMEPIFSAPDIQRQLPKESAAFMEIDKFWREKMRRTAKQPNVLQAMTGDLQPLLPQFIKANAELDRVQKQLEAYLEAKRSVFPRFYFLANDDLLAILSQARDPQKVQPHLRKCFDNIVSLTFTDVPNSTEVLGMNSSEGEYVAFAKNVMTVGSPEQWLGDVEKAMRATIKLLTKQALLSYPDDGLQRNEWLFSLPAQPILTVDCLLWTTLCGAALLAMEDGSNPHAMEEFLAFSKQQITNMVVLVRGDLTPIQRLTMSSMIIIDVHARDVVDTMVQRKTSSTGDFEWIKQMRYYWVNENTEGDGAISKDYSSVPDWETCRVRQVNGDFGYRYEYLGNPTRLVITPLTDKCYLTLTGALSMNNGGAPQGPAGTGKTETVKDLGKALAVQILVFNCSDGLEISTMAQFFSGLAQSGAWACFDEFNRIDIEVLSVIAQQILQIQHAIIDKRNPFEFQGKMIPLDPAFGVFITMNPGYAGRTELPDNLKALFRPVSMMVPDYGMIAQIMLFSEGFTTASVLSKKMVQLYKLASEQLSKQDHYDFGMRAVKSVLVMAGSLKRQDDSVSEDVVLIRAMRDSNVPKFLIHDLPLFAGIISDLFPGVNVPVLPMGSLQDAINDELTSRDLQVVDAFIPKILQLQETMIVRHGVMLVGATMTGKSTCMKVLSSALTTLEKNGIKGQFYNEVKITSLNPKAVSMLELYGFTNPTTLEWTDGLVSDMVRDIAADTSLLRKWIHFDGPVDALWIENMNTVLDDNKVLCLLNSERIRLTPQMTFLFEVEDLAVASPATVSRCGMVFLEPAYLGWMPFIDTWRINFRAMYPLLAERCVDLIVITLKGYVGKVLKFLREECSVEKIGTVDNQLVTSCLDVIDALLAPHFAAYKAKANVVQIALSVDADGNPLPAPSPTNGRSAIDPALQKLLMMNMFVALVWSFGANVYDDSREKFSKFMRETIGQDLAPTLPVERQVYDYTITYDGAEPEFTLWDTKVATYTYDAAQPFFEILVPTVETTTFCYFLNVMLAAGKNVIFSGETGVGKTSIMQDYLAMMHEKQTYVNIPLQFSAQTKPKDIREMLELKLEKKRKTLISAPFGKKAVLFIDDMNMPKLETYGAQPPIELLRQVIDLGGYYDLTKKKPFFKNVGETLFSACVAPPGGGRSKMTPRLTRHYLVMWLPQLAVRSLKKIFTSILGGFLSLSCDHLQVDINSVAVSLTDASVDVFNSCRQSLLPTPAKSHYTFNLRDLSKVVQGILQIKKQNVPDLAAVLRLWMHECARVFRDRLIDEKDCEWFDRMCASKVKEFFQVAMDPKIFPDTMFGDFANSNPSAEKQYQELKDLDSVNHILTGLLEEYNSMFANQMNLVFFKDAVQHLSRISRVLRQPRGNALLVGVGGSGRQSLCRLASYLADYKLVSIEITSGYSVEDWRETIKKVLSLAGGDNTPVVFLFTDVQIVFESFLEDINNLLNTGEVPNCFPPEELDPILQKLRAMAKKAGRPESREGLMAQFVYNCRDNLHIVLAFSPIGDAFRDRCLRYPALVNCCTIDWYMPWPADALYSVAERFITESPGLGLEDHKERLCKLMVDIHSGVRHITPIYFASLQRYNYVTPTSYLELIKLYLSLLGEMREKVSVNQLRYKSGITKLNETNAIVENLKATLIEQAPILAKSSKETAELIVVLEKENKEASETKEICSKEAAETKKEADIVNGIAAECQAGLDEALPILEDAVASLKVLKPADISNMKSYSNPPEGVKKVMEAVCILHDKKVDWASARQLLSNAQFIKLCEEYPKDNIPDKMIKKLKPYTDDEDFTAKKMEAVSSAAVSLTKWVRAMVSYNRVSKEIAPKRAALEAAKAKLAIAQGKLDEKEKALAVIVAKVAKLQATFTQKKQEKENLEASIAKTKAQLVRAEKLVSGLGSEGKRWNDVYNQLSIDLTNLLGNILLSAGCVSYLGPFTSEFRARMTATWVKNCVDYKIPVDGKFNLVRIMGDPLVTRQWNMQGLPADNYSIENGIIVERGRRWPLMIDPQEQANRWIKQMLGKSGLIAIRLSEDQWKVKMEGAIRYGSPCLLENVTEKLDPAIEPILTKQTFKKGGQVLIRLGDQDVPYSANFKFFITTKLPNPHYLPEVFVKVTIINFTVTVKGLEDQLLVTLCGMERRDLEEQMDSLLQGVQQDKKELSDIEANILKLLEESEGDILDNEELIETLAQSRVTASAVGERMAQGEKTLETINTVRESYRVVATRASLLYFVIADLAKIDPMYQYSLMYYSNMYQKVIRDSAALTPEECFAVGLDEADERDRRTMRLATLLTTLTETVFMNVLRGLFERDRILFALLITCSIFKNTGAISDEEFSYLVKGPDMSKTPLDAKGQPVVNIKEAETSPVKWLEGSVWSTLIRGLPAFAQIGHDIREDPEKADDWLQWVTSFSQEKPAGGALPAPYESSLTSFQKLLVLKTMRPDRMIFGIKEYVANELGGMFVKTPTFDLNKVYEQSTCSTPIIFILSTGADPLNYLLTLARSKGIDTATMKILSMGKGQGVIAEEMIKDAKKDGEWVCLQNCHLAASWMGTLERILEKGLTETTTHENYRLWLTSMPSKTFSVPVLQNSLKITTEPPKGVNNQIRQAYADLTEQEYEGCKNAHAYKKLLFGLACFHAIALERKKFGPLGFNIPYEWMISDFVTSKRQLNTFLNTYEQVPWEMLNTIIGDCNYGGRVTDDKDGRCVRSILSLFISPAILKEDYRFCKVSDDSDKATIEAVSAYYAPEVGSLDDARKFCQELPDDIPEVFGMHPNASIALQLKDTKNLLENLLNVAGGGGGGSAASADETAMNIAQTIEKRVKDVILDKKAAHPSTFAGMPGAADFASSGLFGNPLGVFLSQEVERMNKLLLLLKKSLKDLQKSIRGEVVMSPALELMFKALLNQQVPPAWTKAAYPSLKPLGPWVNDLLARVESYKVWLEGGLPLSFWPSGLFFPQGYLTSVLQSFARATKQPIDLLRFNTEVLQVADATMLTESMGPQRDPKKGVLIHGTYLQGAAWNGERGVLVDAPPRVLFAPMNIIWMQPVPLSAPEEKSRYFCPMYKTSARAGELSTTGHSTNFVIGLNLPCLEDQDFWIRRGTALILLLDD